MTFSRRVWLFFSGNARARKAFDQLHSDLYEASFWTNLQDKLRDGFVEDFSRTLASFAFSDRRFLYG